MHDDIILNLLYLIFSERRFYVMELLEMPYRRLLLQPTMNNFSDTDVQANSSLEELQLAIRRVVFLNCQKIHK